MLLGKLIDERIFPQMRAKMEADTFGNCVVIDEAIHSYFAPTAKADHKLRHIPAKPHQDGLLTYVLCQRLHYSGRPISIAFAPTFLDESSSPRDTLVGMIVSLERAGIHPDLEWCIIADSLWSYPTYLSEFVALAWRFIVTAKENCTLVPQALRTLSQTDLVLGQARTYSDGFLTLQTYLSERGVSHILTNAVGVSHHDQNRSIPVLSYHTALSFFTRDSAGGLKTAFSLKPTCLSLRKEQLVHQLTGWDVLREPSQQGSDDPLSEKRLQSFKSAQVSAVYRNTFHRNPPSTATKKDMIAALCPEETVERHISKRRLDRATLEATVQTLQGEQSTEHRIYDTFHRYYSCIEQMDCE